MLIFGLDLGTTSIGFAAVKLRGEGSGEILRMGVRIFPEARDPDGTPTNQQRRRARLTRRQIRRRRQRRRALNELLSDHGFLPRFGTAKWHEVMALDPYDLRARGVSEPLGREEFGRAIYHLAQQRHFLGRELPEEDTEDAADAKEAAARGEGDRLLDHLRESGQTLGAWLNDRTPPKRRRNIHAHRELVEKEFAKLWDKQAGFHADWSLDDLKPTVHQTIFFQRPVFWRKNTLGQCRFNPGDTLCPKGSWLSHQRRMLEKLNNLALAGGNVRPLDPEERTAILSKLQTARTMTWGGVRKALAPLYATRGEKGREKSLRFNLEVTGDKGLIGNPVEQQLAEIFGSKWTHHPHKQALRDAVHDRLWSADYGEIGDQRVVILPASERRTRRKAAAAALQEAFGLTSDHAAALGEMAFQAGWEPYAVTTLRAFLPLLEEGYRMGALLNGPEWEDWRQTTFPNRDAPTGELLDLLPSPRDPQEQARLNTLRNPTVVRVHNELRKVVNNLIRAHGKPDRIHIELAREIGRGKKDREAIGNINRRREKERKEAAKELEKAGFKDPGRALIETWLLWEESGRQCPYTGNMISFDELFREGLYEVEHIWPRSRSLDNSFANKTLCHRSVNQNKGNRTPFEYFQAKAPEAWDGIQDRLRRMMANKGAKGMSPGKVKRFLAETMPEDFAERQMVDTSYAARSALASLKRLWPDLGPEQPVTVQAVSGRVTSHLRRLWGLNNLLADTGEKNRADHRHHAVDALVVALTRQAMVNALSRYWQRKEEAVHGGTAPTMPLPWPTLRPDAQAALADIVVSHRVRKKVSGPLHKGTHYGDTGSDVRTKSGVYREFVVRKPVSALSLKEVEAIRDDRVRAAVADWVADNGGNPKKIAVPPFPTLGPGGPEIRKVRILIRQSLELMAPLGGKTYADLGNNHHVALFVRPDGKGDFSVVSLLEASRRKNAGLPVVCRDRGDGSVFLMSLAQGDIIHYPAESGELAGYWVVQEIATKGQLTLHRHNDAVGDSIFAPRVGSMISKQIRKVSIDPIGRVRPAHD